MTCIVKKTPLFERPAARLALGLLACLALLAVPLVRFAQAAAPAASAPAPLVLRQGNRIVVPADSPLRARLSVAAVDEQASPHSVDLPAVVEVNPANTVNILPPLTGKLVEVKVKLGDTVQRGQVLATLTSPDLAQAQADAQKARDALDLAQRALVRARGVNE